VDIKEEATDRQEEVPDDKENETNNREMISVCRIGKYTI